MSSGEDYLSRKGREYRERQAALDDAVREPLARVTAGQRAVAVTLAVSAAGDPWVELSLWSPQGPPAERRTVERGRACFYLAELDRLLERLTEARERLAREAHRGGVRGGAR